MSSMVDVNVPASLLLQTRMLKTIAYQVILYNQGLLSMDSTTLVIRAAVVVQLLMFLTDYL